MRLARPRSRPASGDVPTQHIAALIEGATSARISTIALYRNDFGRKFEQHESGVEDFARHLVWVRRKENGAEHLRVGPDVLHRISEGEQGGKAWLWEGRSCPFQEGERAETAASLRSHVAEPRAATIETVNGERLHRYTFRVQASRDHEDAVIARMYDHMRHHQITRVSLDVWLTDDGDLRYTREQTTLRNHERAGTPYALTTDYWDFGITTGIAVPSPDQILEPPDERVQ